MQSTQPANMFISRHALLSLPQRGYARDFWDIYLGAIYVWATCLWAVFFSDTFTISLRAEEEPAKRVQFEIYTTGRVDPRSQQDWLQALTKLNVGGLQIRAGQAADQPEIKTTGKPPRESFLVVGMLDAGGVLHVPGGKFGLRDQAGLLKWMQTLGDHGASGVIEQKLAFGLTADQLAAVQEDLAAKLEDNTQGKKGTDILKLLSRGTLRITIDRDVQAALAADDPVRDELKGLSRGTALAALMRPVGAILVPRKPPGREVELWITSADNSPELWPVGWTSDEQLPRLAPKMMDTLNADINGVSAAEALAAVQARVELPFLYDHQSLLLAKIDFKKPVQVAAGKTYYQKLLREVLSNVKCKHEVRLDENGQPFVWISAL
ncbi:MAG: hypothetical protein SFX18_09090 [Pirellulales bacterium]|nr:hypothetical protein [Pirellulales bacterium]